MTEDDARTKWCPMVRMSASDANAKGNHANNRHADASQRNGHNCIGSGCMMWREINEGKRLDVGDVITGGYCGLAGKP